MTNIRQLDYELLAELKTYETKYMKKHKLCSEGLDYPSGEHSCKRLERAIAHNFREKFKKHMLEKVALLLEKQ